MKITVKIPAKHREHIVLFCKDTPFKPKVVKSRVLYKRHSKHKGQHE